jgi:RNA recognition motif-containing protein
VEMSSLAEAKSAIEGLDQKIFDGRTVKVKYATPLKETSKSRSPEKKNANKDLDYVSKQLAKKARNDAKRKSNPLKFKLPTT